MNLIDLLSRMVSRLNKTLKAEYQVLSDEEKALVRNNIHAADKSDWVNPNLLDNWYFLHPVNQRGKTEYNASWDSIDRWRTQGRMTITGNGLMVVRDSESSGPWMIYQRLFNLKQEKFTASILLTEVTGGIIFILQEEGGGWNCPLHHYITEPGFHSVTFTIPAYLEGRDFNFGVVVDPECGSTISAVKLERGHRQTLAHQDSNGNWILNEIPNHSEELLKCQRYMRVFSDRVAISSVDNHSSIISVPITLDNPMRLKVPTITTSNTYILWNQTWVPVNYYGALCEDDEVVVLLMVPATSVTVPAGDACLFTGEVTLLADTF